MANQPLAYADISVFRATPGASIFDFFAWTGFSGDDYTLTAADGQLTSSQPGGAVY